MLQTKTWQWFQLPYLQIQYVRYFIAKYWTLICILCFVFFVTFMHSQRSQETNGETWNEFCFQDFKCIQSIRNVLLALKQLCSQRDSGFAGKKLWADASAGQAAQRWSWWRPTTMTLVLSHQGLHSNSTIMRLSEQCEPLEIPPNIPQQPTFTVKDE